MRAAAFHDVINFGKHAAILLVRDCKNIRPERNLPSRHANSTHEPKQKFWCASFARFSLSPQSNSFNCWAKPINWRDRVTGAHTTANFCAQIDQAGTAARRNAKNKTAAKF